MIRLLDSDQWEEIFDSLTRNKARTFLTAFGIFWGVFMLILLMGGGKGLETMLSSNFAGSASNSGFMISNQTTVAYHGFSKGRYWNIKLQDAASLKNNIPEIDIATPTVRYWGASAKYNNKSSRVGLIGEYTDFAVVDNPRIIKGRALNDVDVLQSRKVCVIGTKIMNELFPNGENPCGKFIDVNNIYYQIVGVSGKKGGINVGSSPESTVHLPYTTMQNLYNKGDNVDILCLTAKSNHKMSDVQYKVEQYLKRVHDISPDDTQALMKINTEAIYSMIDNLFTGISILVWMIGLGTLLSGAIGVSNIMIVTVKERTTEIGIRRAIGATPRNILSMILTESIVLTLLAGMSGIVLAVLILQVMEAALSDPTLEAHFQIDFNLAIGAASLLTLLGVAAGLAPALRAMNIKPVDAMREE